MHPNPLQSEALFLGHKLPASALLLQVLIDLSLDVVTRKGVIHLGAGLEAGCSRAEGRRIRGQGGCERREERGRRAAKGEIPEAASSSVQSQRQSWSQLSMQRGPQ